MAFKVGHAERENVTTISTLDVPEDFLTMLEAEFKFVQADPTYEIVVEGDTAKETALYVLWAKFWGMNREQKISVFKQPVKKGGPATVARLLLKPYDPDATPRGRKPNGK